MKVNAILFWILSLFFGIAAVAYALWSLVEPVYGIDDPVQGVGSVEWVGTVGLSLTSIFGAFLGFYLQRTYVAQGGELAEDRRDADIDDGDAEQGFFSPWSWWPFVLSAALAVVFLGLAVGVWLIFIGGALTIVAVVGLQFEYYRGNFAR